MKYIYILLFSFLANFISAQECTSSKGSYYNQATTSGGTVCFSKTTNHVADLYSSAYTISTMKGKDMYKIEMIVDKKGKTITVNSSNLEIGSTTNKIITYQDDYSLVIINNYGFNDTLVDSVQDYSILFFIPDTLEPYASLSQFTSEGVAVNYRLEKFKAVYLKKHLIIARSYHSKQQALTKKLVPVEVKPQLCEECIRALKVTMDADAEKIMMSVMDSVKSGKNAAVIAGNTLQVEFNQKMEKMIEADLAQLNLSSTTVNQSLAVKVNTNGQVTNVTDTFFNSTNYEAYANLWTASIKPKISSLTFTPEKKNFSMPDMFNNFYKKYYNDCAKLDSSMNSYNDFFTTKRTRMDSLANIVVSVPTVYRYYLHFESVQSMRKWRLRKDKEITDLTGETTHTVKSEAEKSAFFSNNVKRKLGRYRVFINSFTFSDKPAVFRLDSVKRKYTFYTYIGASAGIQIPLSTGRTKAGELVLVEAMIVHHWIGFFGGGTIYNTNVNGEYINASKKPSYFNAGLYLGPCNYFYFKLGYSQLNTYGIGNNDVAATKRPGFIAGLSFLFPYVHIEGGYNYAMNAFYVNGGLNIPINR